VPVTMLVGMGGLAVLCMALGLGAPVVAPVLSRAVAALRKSGAVEVADGTVIFLVMCIRRCCPRRWWRW